MMPLSSSLESRQEHFTELRNLLEQQGFSLGGNWDYTNGSFDRALDEAQKVWLRIPFQVITGHVDDSAQDRDAKIVLGTPYVLKHVYNEGNDLGGNGGLVSGLFNQFQPPLDPDARIEPKWLSRAKKALEEAEQAIQS
ncbi:YugN family protein [Paenibacillus sp. NPDC058071]|uniref:YugN family protein n=1 Tax=Paenibacillus sp. NPDC058071 TaxID=3346326 RepID=UPI0036DDB2A5